VTGERTHRILCVDDDPHSLDFLRRVLGAHGYTVDTACDGQAALDAVHAVLPDLILLDLDMPVLDGLKVAERIKADARTSSIPIIMVTGMTSRQTRLEALEAGAEEFLTKPVDLVELRVRVQNLLRLKEYQDLLVDHNRLLERRLAERSAQLRDSYRETILALVSAAEYRDTETGTHVKRISFYCRLLASAMGMDREFVESISYASPMHDIGKIGIPDHILLKPGPLNPEESEIMKTHTLLGARILGKGQSPYLKMAVDIALSHHESYNGDGYPLGLCGEDIPVAARIMSLCDRYDAIRSARPYKKAFSHDTTVEIITLGSPRSSPEHFDPNVFAAFQEGHEAFREIYEMYRDENAPA